MAENEIDYKSIAERLQKDNEKARLEIIRLRFSRFPHLSLLKRKRMIFETKNIIRATLLLYLVSALLDCIAKLRKKSC